MANGLEAILKAHSAEVTMILQETPPVVPETEKAVRATRDADAPAVPPPQRDKENEIKAEHGAHLPAEPAQISRGIMAGQLNSHSPGGNRKPLVELHAESPGPKPYVSTQKSKGENFSHIEDMVLWRFIFRNELHRFCRGQEMWKELGDMATRIILLGRTWDQLYNRAKELTKKNEVGQRNRSCLTQEERDKFKEGGCRGMKLDPMRIIMKKIKEERQEWKKEQCKDCRHGL
jgi:hypothetical protein